MYMMLVFNKVPGKRDVLILVFLIGWVFLRDFQPGIVLIGYVAPAAALIISLRL